MGNIIEKLEYLDETINKLTPAWIIRQFNKQNITTTREKIAYIMEWVNLIAQCIENDSILHLPNVKFETADGINLRYICGLGTALKTPKVVYSGEYTFPITLGARGSGTSCDTDTNRMGIVDFSGYTPESYATYNYFSFYTKYVAISRLVLPRIFSLKNMTMYGFSNRYTFKYGLALGQLSSNCSSSWISNTINSSYEKDVTCWEDFEGTIYLARIPMSAETMVGLFNNLKDLTGTGTTYTFNVGTKNLAKLTEEQKDIAREKGWNLT